MSRSGRTEPGHLWGLVQHWIDATPHPTSQRKLAALLGISAAALSQWKYAEGFPTPGNLRRLADAIATPYDQVLDAVLRDQGYLD